MNALDFLVDFIISANAYKDPKVSEETLESQDSVYRHNTFLSKDGSPPTLPSPLIERSKGRMNGIYQDKLFCTGSRATNASETNSDPVTYHLVPMEQASGGPQRSQPVNPGLQTFSKHCGEASGWPKFDQRTDRSSEHHLTCHFDPNSGDTLYRPSRDFWTDSLCCTFYRNDARLAVGPQYQTFTAQQHFQQSSTYYTPENCAQCEVPEFGLVWMEDNLVVSDQDHQPANFWTRLRTTT